MYVGIRGLGLASGTLSLGSTRHIGFKAAKISL